MTRTSVVNVRTSEYDVYIGRDSAFGDTKWGNPFRIGRDGNRAKVITKYYDWIMGQPNLLAATDRELLGKRLGCHCAPLPCHGDVLADLAERRARCL